MVTPLEIRGRGRQAMMVRVISKEFHFQVYVPYGDKFKFQMPPIFFHYLQKPSGDHIQAWKNLPLPHINPYICDDINGVQALLGKVLILNHALWQPLPSIEGNQKQLASRGWTRFSHVRKFYGQDLALTPLFPQKINIPTIT